MGVEVGFEFYRFLNGELKEANIIDDCGDRCNYLFICGRCDATYLFIDLVEKFRKRGAYKDDAKPEDRYSSYLLLNHPELDGFEDHSNENEWRGWFKKYFYYSLGEFKDHFDFDEAQRKHDELLKELKDELNDLHKEQESLRTHQENAKTKVAFDGFEDKIQETKENICSQKEYIKDIEEDDYGYNHFMWIKEAVKRVEEIMKEDPDIVVVAFASY